MAWGRLGKLDGSDVILNDSQREKGWEAQKAHSMSSVSYLLPC